MQALCQPKVGRKEGKGKPDRGNLDQELAPLSKKPYKTNWGTIFF